MRLKKRLLVQAVALAAVSAHTMGQTLEEIVVTAQKKTESLQDVPISVNAVSGDFLDNSGVANLEEMSSFVPNLDISDSPGSNSIKIRGLGTGSGTSSFEQSVGLYVDGIYAARSRQFQVPFMDVERVEVLRGPQGVLFGKNSIAGAVSVISAKPSEAFEAEISAKYEMEYGSYEAQGFVSGQLADNLYGRLAVKTTDNEGYIDNEVLNEDWPETDSDAIRATFVWDATDDTKVTFKLEQAELDEKGNHFQLIDRDETAPPTAGVAGMFDLGIRYALATTSDEDFKLDDKTYVNNQNFLSLDSENYSIQVNHSIGEYELTYIGGYSEYESSASNDADFSALEYISDDSSEDYDQVSHEIRLASPIGETFEYMLGAYYIDRELEYSRFADGSYDFFDVVASDFNPGGPQNFMPPAALLGMGISAYGDLNHTQVKAYTEEAEAWSVFFQGTWHITDNLRATLGARYSEETKEVSSSFLIADQDTLSGINDPAILGLLSVFGIANHTVSDLPNTKRDEENLDPAFNVQWDFSDNGMAYFNWTKATKAGGFNSSHSGQDHDFFEFEEEEAESMEVGVKLDLMEGRARLNAAYFYTEFDDLQVSYWDAVASAFRVGNAAQATSEGVEVEATLAWTEAWTVGGNFAWLNVEYDEYIGACPSNANEWSASCVSTGGANQDLSGAPLADAAEWSGSLFADYITPVGDSMMFSARVDANYKHDSSSTTLDSYLDRDAYWKYNMRLALSDLDETWTVALMGKNLTDEETFDSAGDAVTLAGVYWGNYSSPRQIELSATYRFY